MQNANFGDEEILKGATQSLLRFDGISKEIFPKGSSINCGYGRRDGQFGKCSKNSWDFSCRPTSGAIVLRRVGVMFNETQEATIKGFVESGKKTEAKEFF